MTSLLEQEREKYEAVWAHASYREQADGEPAVERTVKQMGCMMGQSIIDWGCGNGTCARMLSMVGLKVTGFDIAPNCLDKDVTVPLVVGTLWNPPHDLRSDYAFCTDVLEHIPPIYLLKCLDEIAAHTNYAAFIQIDTFPDLSGPRMNPPRHLHLSLHGPYWWNRELLARWRVVEMSPGLFTRWRYLCRK